MAKTAALALLAAALLVLMPASQAQILPSLGLFAEVLNLAVAPQGETAYGTPRTFAATIVNLGTGTSTFSGNLTFVDGNGVVLCTTPVINDASLAGVSVEASSAPIDLQVAALNNIINLNPALAYLGTITASTLTNPLLVAPLQALGIYPLKANAGVIAACTTPYIPPGTYTNINVAYGDLQVNGQTIGISQIPILNPTINLSLLTISVRKANTIVFSFTDPSVAAGQSTTLVAEVQNIDNLPSILYVDGGSVSVLLADGTVIGQGPLTSNQSRRRRQLLALTSLFNVPITVPSTVATGPQTLTLVYSGTNNFNPSASGLNGSPSGPTLTVLPPTATSISQSVTPLNPAANGPITVTATITAANGATPVGTTTITITPTAGGTPITYSFPQNGNTFNQIVPAPGTPGTYTVVTSFAPAAGNTVAAGASGPTTITVGPAVATITETITPNPADPGQTVTATGTVTNADGSAGTGTVQIYINGVAVGTPVTLGPGGTFTTTFPAPTTGGVYVVRTDYTPTGATAPVASFAANLSVNGGTGGTAPTNLTFAFSNGGRGFTFPNCAGNLNLTISASGTPPPSGNVTLYLSGSGLLGSLSKNATLGTEEFMMGSATFELESVKLDTAVIEKITGNHKYSASLLGPGVFALLPGRYTLTACYAGDTVYAPTCATTPYEVDPLCLLQALRLVA